MRLLRGLKADAFLPDAGDLIHGVHTHLKGRLLPANERRFANARPTSEVYTSNLQPFDKKELSGSICISPNASLRAQRSNPLWLANLALMDRRVAALLAMTDLCRPSLVYGGLCRATGCRLSAIAYPLSTGNPKLRVQAPRQPPSAQQNQGTNGEYAHDRCKLQHYPGNCRGHDARDVAKAGIHR